MRSSAAVIHQIPSQLRSPHLAKLKSIFFCVISSAWSLAKLHQLTDLNLSGMYAGNSRHNKLNGSYLPFILEMPKLMRLELSCWALFACVQLLQLLTLRRMIEESFTGRRIGVHLLLDQRQLDMSDFAMLTLMMSRYKQEAASSAQGPSIPVTAHS